MLDAILTLLNVGAVLSNVTLPPPLVTAVPAFPAESLNAILYVIDKYGVGQWPVDSCT